MIKLERHEMPQEGVAFIVMPYGAKSADGTESVNFDELYERVYADTITKCGMRAVRADGIWGSDRGILDVVWRGIQTAEVVIVDCSGRSIDVGLELGLSMALGKRLIVTAQRIEDVPTDLRGHLRPVLYKAEGLGFTDLVRGLEKELESVRNETVIENTFVSVKTITGEPKPGRVIAVQTESVIVETEGEEELLHLHAANVTYTKHVTDMTRQYKYGDRLSGAITTDLMGKRYYTLLADKQNPWPTIESDYPAGRVFSGHITNVVEGKGAWVPIFRDINGHLPADEARRAGLRRGDEVEVVVAYVDVSTRKIGLHLRSGSSYPLPKRGEQMHGWVVRSVPEKGFVLLSLEGYEKERPALLHIKHMLPELAEDLRNGKVEVDEGILVEVTGVRQRDDGQWNIDLRERAEAQADLAA
jgi:small subunit ribosomal protein S1